MTRPRGRPLALLAVVAVAAMLSLLPVASEATTRMGWVRLAHLSPDTRQLDVTLSSLSGGTVLMHFGTVGYGDVSAYVRLPIGTYAVAMVPAGSAADSAPVVTTGITVKQGAAETLAVMNLNAALETHVFTDDLGAPARDSARVRVIAAATKHREVSVTAGSTTVADRVTFPRASGYAQLHAGRVEVSVRAGSAKATESTRFGVGTVHTVFVLDTAKGGLAITPVLDSAGATVAPSGGVDTGAGGLAGGRSTASLAAGLALLAGAGAAAAGVLLVRRPSAAAAAAGG
jgi:hypothetical protein